MGFFHQFAKLSTASELNIQRIKVHQGLWNVWILFQPVATISMPLQWLTMRFLSTPTVFQKQCFRKSVFHSFCSSWVLWKTFHILVPITQLLLALGIWPYIFLTLFFLITIPGQSWLAQIQVCILQSRANVELLRLRCWDKLIVFHLLSE